MSEQHRIRDQLRRAFERGAWHGPSVKEVLAGVTAVKAASKPAGGAHSIWELVNHIGAWKRIIRRRVEGEVVSNVPDEQSWPAVNDTSEAAWTGSLDELEQGHILLCETVSQMDESRLDEVVPGEDFSFYVMLHGVAQHDLYHAGQVALLKKIYL